MESEEEIKRGPFRVVECLNNGVVNEVEDLHAGQKKIEDLFRACYGKVKSIRYMTAYYCLEELIVDEDAPEGEWHCICSQLKD